MNKICTSIEQSKKLLELGIDINTADIWWNCRGAICAPLMYCEYPTCEKRTEKDIPAWSIAALLNILPNNKYITTTLSRGGWKIEPTEYVDKWWCEYEDDDHTKDFSVSADNPVDACVAMIEKLHELNML